MGAAMTGLRPVAEIMFSDFFAVCWDIVANQIAKTRYMTDGQCLIPAGDPFCQWRRSARFGAQHSQSVENWAMAIPGLKVVAPSNAADVKGSVGGSHQGSGPGACFLSKSLLYGTKCEVPEGEHLVPLGQANVLRQGDDVSIVALAAMVPKSTKGGGNTAKRAWYFSRPSLICDAWFLSIPRQYSSQFHLTGRTGNRGRKSTFMRLGG